ncbi:CDP-glycerol glycerophosphotransferase family protein [Butyrivibrio sp. VCD2006]|uniref:CDP-glycerol glycerophosphotransferase family protein n=1 Tax=Butyrivibrio sp. VCD2006 TaxID=1280664 RepID=UPI000427BF43|nr:CDP-glycerol glycerophosphotransferase family protein [Butyrivibrio sp. VCD2006]
MRFFKKLYGSIFRFVTRKIIFQIYFWMCSRAPIEENKVTFMELRLPNLSNNFQLLHKELTEKYDLNVKVHYIRQGFARGKDKYGRIFAFLKDAATSKYIILNEGSDIAGGIKKREGQHIMNTWHGCGAFKKFGRSTRDKIFGDSGKTADRYPGHPDYDLVTVSSPEIVWAYVEAMGKEDKPECIKPLGLSRTDVFYDEKFIAQAKENVAKEVPASKDKKILLYAPTFRGRTKWAFSPSELDIGKFYENFHEEYVLLFKHHPITHERPQIPAEYADFAFDVTDSLSIEDLLCVSDICISDYSSLIFEYSIFERPMVFFAFDLDEYFDWRGFYYDYDELTPGPVFSTNDEMIDYIKHIDERFDRNVVREFRNKFMASCDGNATKRVIMDFFGNDIQKYVKAGSDPEVSIVMPSYNVSEFIDECLKSVIKQTFKNIEIIIVDDESTDDTVSKIRKYMEKDKRISLIEQKHSNAGDARNRGLEAAKGKYVIFWDTDDFFELDAIEKMYKQAEMDKADICLCNGNNFDGATKRIMETTRKLNEEWIPEKVPFNYESDPDHFILVTALPLWNKLYRRDFLMENNIRCQSQPKINDAYFSLVSLYAAKSITIVNEKLIHYRINEATSTTRTTDVSPLYVFDAYEKAKDYLVEKGIYEEVKRGFVNKALTGYLYSLRKQCEFNNIDNFKAVFDYMKDKALQKLGVDDLEPGYIYESDKEEKYSTIRDESYEVYLFDYLQYKIGAYDNTILTHKDKYQRLMKKYERMKNSFAYKVGMKVTWPIRYINARLHGTKIDE